MYMQDTSNWHLATHALHSKAQTVYGDVLTLVQPARSPLPGQYVDLYIPNISTVGGFTITSAPLTTRQPTDPYIELAIQKSPNNPPAAYLWQPTASILNKPVSFRVGGNFIYPPSTLSQEECRSIDRAVFVAGGVGINPIISMLRAMDSVGPAATDRIGGLPRRTTVLYSSRRNRSPDGKKEDVLFYDDLLHLASKWKSKDGVDYWYTFFETSAGGRDGEDEGGNVRYRNRRISHEDLQEALGPKDDRANTVVYVCGLPAMTDEFVEVLSKAKGMEKRRVLTEKWW
jgi:hypothetical protein